MPFHEYIDPGPGQIVVWLSRALDSLGPTMELTEIVKFNNRDGYILEDVDFDFVKRHYPILITKCLTESFDSFNAYVDDLYMRELLLTALEDLYCPNCSTAIENFDDQEDDIQPSKLDDDRLKLKNRDIYEYDQNSNMVKMIGYDSKNKIINQEDHKYDSNNKCIEKIVISDLNKEGYKTIISYDLYGKEIKSHQFKLEKQYFGNNEIPDGFSECLYGDNNLLVKEIFFDENSSILFTNSYKYENDKLIELSGPYGKTSYEYDSNGQKIIEVDFDEFDDLQSKIKLEYKNNILIASGSYDVDDDIKSITKYNYINGNLVERLYYKILNKNWCKKCDKWVSSEKRSEPPKLEY